MVDESRIDRTIESIVTGCGLDVRRQEDLAEELRAHLWHLIASKREGGLEPERAIDAALAQFGSTRVIRRAIRRQRRGADARAVLADVQKSAWLPIGLGVLLAFVIAATTVAVSPADRLIIGVISAIALSFALTLPVFAGFCWCRIQVLRPRLKARFEPVARTVEWTLRIGALLTALSLAIACIFAVGTTLYEMSGWSHIYARSLASYLGRALIQALAPLGATALFGAIVVVILERIVAARLETRAT